MFIKEKKIIFFVWCVLCNFYYIDNILLINISVDIKLIYSVCKVFFLRYFVIVFVKKNSFILNCFVFIIIVGF